MAIELILVVGKRSAITDRLRELLDDNGVAVRLVDPSRLDGIGDSPGLVLADASVDVRLVREWACLISLRTNRSTRVVTFTADDVTGQEPNVLSAVNFLVPGAVREIDIRTALRKYRREFRTGRESQAGFLPEVLPVRSGWQLDARFLPAGGVSGDFYDVFELPGGERIGLVVADVCDKGIGAALYMALIRSLLRYTAAAFESEQPSDTAWLLRAIDATNDYLTTNHLRDGYFATLFFAVLDPATGALVFSNCGHNPPVLRNADGAHQLLGPTGPALGLLPDSTFELDHTQLDHGDLLFVYTDGVTDARDEHGRFFSEERMLALVRGHTTGTEDLLDRFDREISGHVGTAERFDDITMVALLRQLVPVWQPDSPNL
ncbi:PP2C family protein-serine/threonine phosphatase [Kutzneria chonburiensis]|uniref:PP2C family protein-serine/threonine phosphatase n=1 Tax=Kutzneria chonburiensis TaxID=1483604 RepID=A0ABV6MX39_9PSEU|nr:PP2C family protein-serine/threonine phosphatase [Kutzneria chonburiensis]